MGKDTKSSNAKVIWYILFAFVTVILIYLCTVAYFFYISPYNISIKTKLWSFLSDQMVGEMYLDATVEIDFTIKNPITYENEDKIVVGVNVREDGYIVAPYSEFRACNENTEIKIYTNSGKIYVGKLLYGDINYNLAILKCENIAENLDEIKIPYVYVSSKTSLSKQTEVLAIASPMKTKNVWNGKVVDTNLLNVYKQIEVENNYAIDFVLENCYSVEIDSSDENAYTGGAIFDKSGSILGLSYEDTLDDGSYIIMPIDASKLFLDNVVKNYQKQQTYENQVIKKFVGFDQTEIYCHMLASAENSGKEEYFYFNGSWQIYSDELIAFSNSGVDGYYLFEDFSYEGETILSAKNVISSLKINGKTYSANYRTSLMNALYKTKTGDVVTIYYYDTNSLGIKLSSVNFTV